MRQLDKTVEVVAEDGGVQGSRLHAWKNLARRVATNWKARVAAFALVVPLTVSMAGCAPNTNEPPTNDPSPSISQTAEPSPTPVGDVINSGTTVTTPHGDYQQAAIDPDSPAMQWDESKVGPAGLGNWTQEDALSAQQASASFIASEGTDSSVYNGTLDEANAWYDSHREYFDPAWYDSLMIPNGGSDRPNIINANPLNMNPMAVYDGQMRVAHNDVAITRVETYTEAGAEYLAVSGVANTKYRSTDEGLIAAMKAQGGTDAEIQSRFPQLYDADANNSTFNLDTTFTHWLSRGDNGKWQISGYSTTFRNAEPSVS